MRHRDTSHKQRTLRSFGGCDDDESAPGVGDGERGGGHDLCPYQPYPVLVCLPTRTLLRLGVRGVGQKASNSSELGGLNSRAWVAGVSRRE